MRRIMFDTNVYGVLIKEPEAIVRIASHTPNDFVVYGTPVIRNELRALSKEAKLDQKSKRVLLLNVYDSFIRKENHNLKITDIIEIIAQDYFIEYKKAGGALSLIEMINDLRIVACAAVHHLDIAISEDQKSMLSLHSLRAYTLVNKKNQLRNPEFISCQKPPITDWWHDMETHRSQVVFDAQNSTNSAVFEHNRFHLNHSSEMGGILLFKKFKEDYL